MLIPTVPLWASESDSSLVKFLEQDIFTDLVIFSFWPKIFTFLLYTYLDREFNADFNETIETFWIRFFNGEKCKIHQTFVPAQTLSTIITWYEHI